MTGALSIADYRVLVADDHPLYRTALANLVAEAFDDVVIAECEDVDSALQHLREAPVDLVLFDLTMPNAEGLDGLQRLRQAFPTTPVMVCSALDDPALVRESFRLGVSGYLPKSSGASVTRHALQLVRGGGVYVPSEALAEAAPAVPAGDTAEPAADSHGIDALTPRQQAVLVLLEQGLSNKAIARELDIGEITVKAHVSAILRKLEVENRVQAVVAAQRLRR